MVARGGDFDDEGPPPGVPVAMDVIRNGPIESDDEDEATAKNRRNIRSRDRPTGEPKPVESELLDEDGNPGDESEAADEAGFLRVSDAPPLLPSIDGGDSIHMPSRLPSRNQSKASRYTAAGDGYNTGVFPQSSVPILAEVPNLPRKSSKRPLSHDGKAQQAGQYAPSEPGRTVSVSSSHAGQYQQPYLAPAIRVESTGSGGGGLTTTRLPFDRNNSLQGRMSEGSSAAHTNDDFAQIDLNDNSSNNTGPGRGSHEDRPTSYGYVQQGSINRIDPERQPDLLGTSAEVVDEHH